MSRPRNAGSSERAQWGPVFESGGGETGALFRSIDWSKSVLGPIDRWPASLKIVLNAVFATQNAMLVWWGSDLIQFYNDAYLPSLPEGKHPTAMGQGARACWPEIWPVIGPQIEGVMTRGEPTWNRDQLFPSFHRSDVDAYWSYGYSPIFDEAGRVGGVLVVCTETTDQVVANRRLQEANAAERLARDELQRFLVEAPVGIAILSGPEHVFSFVNTPYMSWCFGGRPSTDLLNRPVREALPELEGQGIYQLLDRVYLTGEPFVGAKIRVAVLQADGRMKEMFINFSYQARRDAHGHIDGIVVVVNEVTDQVNEQREVELLASNLREALVARDTFIGVASHELKTPLTSLKLQLQMAQRRLKRRGDAALTGEETAALLDISLTQTDRLERLVNDMLDASRIASGNLSLHRAPTDLSALVVEVLDRFAFEFESAGCAVSRDIAPEVVADVDAARVEQVVTNFFTNALKYARGKPVHVRVGRDPQGVRVSVRDEGPGIAFADQGRVFERFERATPARHVSGMGLGLYISKQIVAQHRGRIFVDSAPGRGAEFGFVLPIERPSG